MIPRPPIVINDRTGKCKAHFDSGSCKWGDRCRFRHYLTPENDSVVQSSPPATTTINPPKPPDDKTIGWTKIHDLVFHAEYEKLAAILQSTANHTALLSAMTNAPKTIHWSEFDVVDGSTDRYTITIPAYSTPLDVAFTSSNDLTSGEAALYNLFDSTDHVYARFVCTTLLLHPTRARDILAYVQSQVEGIVSWNDGDGWTLLHELCFRGSYELFTECFYYFHDFCAWVERQLSTARVIRWYEEEVEFDNEAATTSSTDMEGVKEKKNNKQREFKITIPSGYSVRQIMAMTSKELDIDSPCREQTKKYLLDSVEHGETRRQLLEYIDSLHNIDHEKTPK
jgi:hypothetical protein